MKPRTDKPAPAISGTLFDRMYEGIELSEAARTAAQQQNNRIHDEVRAEIEQLDAQRNTVTPETTIVTDGDRRAGNDWFIKAKISREQWGARLSDMYANAASAELLSYMHKQNKEIINRLDTMIDLLGQIAAASVRH